MALKLISIVLTIILFPIYAWGQDYLQEEILINSLPTFEDLVDEGLLNQPLYWDDFEIVDINKASSALLATLPGLTASQIQSLLHYIEHNGPLVSIYELQAIPGLDLTTIRLIQPLVQITESSESYDPRGFGEQIKHDGGIEFMIRAKRRVELSKGYFALNNQGFKGSPYYILSRIQYKNKGDISFGVTSEKDPGEKFSWDLSRKLLGSDYLSMYLTIKNKGIVKRLVIGDFKAQWAQGLVLYSGFSLWRLALTGPRKSHGGFSPHTGTNESGFFRGVGAEIQLGKTTISTMYSHRSLDVQTLSSDSSLGLPKRVTSIIISGLHRTSTEIERRQKLPEQVIGLHVGKLINRGLNISVSGVFRNWRLPLIPRGNKYSFRFSGKNNYNISGSFEFVWENINSFGQIAISKSGGWSGLLGLVTSFSPTIAMSFHLRNYSKEYFGISANAFGIRSGNNNERGIYWGLQVTPSKHWVAEGYSNLYKFPWVTHQSDGISLGSEHMIRFKYLPNKGSEISLFWRLRTRLINDDPLLPKLSHNLTNEMKQIIGLNARWQGNSKFLLQTRLQYSQVSINHISTNGMLISNQVSYNWDFVKFTASMAIFETFVQQ